MATTNLRVDELETDAALQRRIAQEAELIAQARVSAAGGYVVSEEDADAWIVSLGSLHELPVPDGAANSRVIQRTGRMAIRISACVKPLKTKLPTRS